MNTASFRFSPDILRRLGEELITSFHQGIIELVKNAYDADATNCVVELKEARNPGGAVIIYDDGDGMTFEDIRNGWLILGTSGKDPRIRTRRNRLPAGSKGLGRLGALRMGKEALLVTRPRSELGSEYSVLIRWSEFDKSRVVEDVSLVVRRSDSAERPGTRIEIRELRTGVGKKDVRSLARELILLADPFGDPESFNPTLVAEEFTEIEELVQRAYFQDFTFRLIAQLDEQGIAKGSIADRTGKVIWKSDAGDFEDCYPGPSATFELWVYLLNEQSFAGRGRDRWGGAEMARRGRRHPPVPPRLESTSIW